MRVIHEPGPVLGAAFDHDGSEVVTRGTDRFARLYATNDGRLLRTFDQGGTVHVATFSPRRDLLLTAGANKTARIWDPQDGPAAARAQGAHRPRAGRRVRAERDGCSRR